MAGLNDTLALQQQIVRLQALFEASRRIHSTIQLDEVLRSALDIIVRELEMEGAFYSAFPFSEGRIQPKYLFPQSANSGGRGSVSFPLRDKAGATITDLIVIPREGMPLSLEEADFLDSLAIQTSVAIENARHHERALQLERVEFDLANARAIQRSMLPRNLPQVPGYTIALRSLSCYEVGGDYLDVVSKSTGEQVMIVADVAGKGLASAMIASSFRAAFRAMVSSGMPLVDVALRLNALQYAEGEEARRRYITALLLHLDPANNLLEVVNAGHNPGLLWLSKGKQPILLEASGTPVGMLPIVTYRSELYEFGPGARLLAYTDGLTEVFCGEEEFGSERLAETFLTGPSHDGEAILDSIWRAIGSFSNDREPSDDMTALVILRQ